MSDFQFNRFAADTIGAQFVLSPTIAQAQSEKELKKLEIQESIQKETEQKENPPLSLLDTMSIAGLNAMVYHGLHRPPNTDESLASNRGIKNENKNQNIPQKSKSQEKFEKATKLYHNNIVTGTRAQKSDYAKKLKLANSLLNLF